MYISIMPVYIYVDVIQVILSDTEFSYGYIQIFVNPITGTWWPSLFYVLNF